MMPDVQKEKQKKTTKQQQLQNNNKVLPAVVLPIEIKLWSR